MRTWQQRWNICIVHFEPKHVLTWRGRQNDITSAIIPPASIFENIIYLKTCITVMSVCRWLNFQRRTADTRFQAVSLAGLYTCIRTTTVGNCGSAGRPFTAAVSVRSPSPPVLKHDSPIVRHMFCNSIDSIYTLSQASGSEKLSKWPVVAKSLMECKLMRKWPYFSDDLLPQWTVSKWVFSLSL